MQLRVFGVGLEEGLNNFDRLVRITDGNKRFNEAHTFEEETGRGSKLFFCHEIKKGIILIYYIGVFNTVKLKTNFHFLDISY